MKRFLTGALVALFALCTTPALAGMGPSLVIKESSYDVAGTVAKLEGAVAKKGLNVFAKIDHAAGGAKIGEILRPTILVVFGTAKIGTPLIQQGQLTGLDLPLKVLVYQDEDGKTRIAYRDPATIANNHGLAGDQKAMAVIKKMAAGLDAFTNAAAR